MILSGLGHGCTELLYALLTQNLSQLETLLPFNVKNEIIRKFWKLTHLFLMTR